MLRKIVSPARTVVAFVVAFLVTGVAATVVSVLAWRNPTSQWVEKIINGWSKTILGVAGVRLSVDGLENVEPDRSYVMVSNHQSAFDIPAEFLALPIPLRFLAKKELFGIPVFGTALRAIGIVEVDRQAGAAVHKQINAHSAEVIKRGHSILVFAEGTRYQDGAMRAFKRGAFSIAIESGLPILPVMVHGGHLAWPPRRPIYGGPMHVSVAKPIDTEGLVHKDVADLRDQTWEVINDMLESFEQA